MKITWRLDFGNFERHFSRSAPHVSEEAQHLYYARMYMRVWKMKRPPTHINLSEHIIAYFADR